MAQMYVPRRIISHGARLHDDYLAQLPLMKTSYDASVHNANVARCIYEGVHETQTQVSHRAEIVYECDYH